MHTTVNRRAFLSKVGQGMLAVSVGVELASDLRLARADVAAGADPLIFGSLEPLVVLMQETPADKLLPKLMEQLDAGTDLKTLVAAATLANARTFGGEDYIGYHTLMALAPAWHMSRELSGPRQALPVFKVLYRNTNRIGEHGGRNGEVLHPVQPMALSAGDDRAKMLSAAVAAKDIARAEQIFAAIATLPTDEAFEALLHTVQEDTHVHRIVLPYRAYELSGLIGKEHAHTLLRQSVHYCVKEYTQGDATRILPAMLEAHKLLDRQPGDRAADDAWIESLSQTIFAGSPESAADAAGAALAEGFSPAAVREAISLAASQLVLRDPGRSARQEWPGKPIGSVHGDSVGVHACDSANAWCNMSSVGSPRNTFACLILGALQVAQDRGRGGADYVNLPALPLDLPYKRIKENDAAKLLADLDSAVRDNQQAQATNIVNHYGQLGHDARPLFDVLLKYAISEDGALHAEKYYRTTSEEFARTRPAFRWRQAIALARVTASEYGRPAPGYGEACELLKIS